MNLFCWKLCYGNVTSKLHFLLLLLFFLQPNFFIFSKCMISSKTILKNDNALVR
ncbi:hypothetical protein ACMBCN_03260 [Candidatus Liberibacter asiaticus]|nr:hypothetical protein [Candidatus Liberibacter asiaticus]